MSLAFLVSVPVVTALIGWITNVVAVRMLYGPEHFVGIGRIGWQGVAFRHHERFAEGYAGVTASYLLSPGEILDELSADDLVAVFEELVSPEDLARFVEEGFEALRPGLWRSLSPKFRESITGQVYDEEKKLLRSIHARLRDEADTLFDVRAFLREALARDGGRTISRISQEIGRKELRFIELFGGIFGLVVGVAEVFAWAMFQTGWILPFVGGLVGAGTNWLALRMVFRPLEPTTYLGVSFQGLFPKRKKEFAREFAAVLARDLLSVPAIVEWMTRGENGRRLEALAWETVEPQIRSLLDRWEMMLPVEVENLDVDRLRRETGFDVATWGGARRERFETCIARRVNLARSMAARLERLSPVQFEHLVRGPFEEDEWILVAVGFLLGALIGAAQAGILALR